MLGRLRQQRLCIAQPEIERNRQQRHRQGRQRYGGDIAIATHYSSGSAAWFLLASGECPAACVAAVPACFARIAPESGCHCANRYPVPQADPDKRRYWLRRAPRPTSRFLLLHSVGRTNINAPTINMPATTQNDVMRCYLCVPLAGLQLA